MTDTRFRARRRAGDNPPRVGHHPDWKRYPDLWPLKQALGDDVELLGCYSSGTETRAGQDILDRSTAVWCPRGRPADALTGRPSLHGAQVCYVGSDVAAFRAAVVMLPDPRTPLLPWPGHLFSQQPKGRRDDSER